MICLHLIHNKPYDKHFFGVYSSIKNVIEVLSNFCGGKIPTEVDIHSTFIASDVFILKDKNYEIIIGEIKNDLVEFACGKTTRIKQDALLIK